MADTARPRPRPRPKPKAKAPSQPVLIESSTAPASSSSAGFLPSSPRVVEVRDDDEMFMRNRKRTTTTWHKIAEKHKEAKRNDQSSDSDEGGSSERLRKHKKKVDQRILPRWQRDKEFVRLLSADPSSDSDSDIHIVEGSTPNTKRSSKRKRQQGSRSRSITPPPALPLYQIQNARNLVRQTLLTAPRAASPTYEFDDSTDTIILDPELARLAQTITSQSSSLQHHTPVTSESATVIISVRWQPHPLNGAGKSNVWVFKMNRDDNFRDLFEATAEEASILTDDLIISYNNNRLFSSVTPRTLKIWGEVELMACDRKTHEYLRKHSLIASRSDSFDALAGPPSDADADAPSPSNPNLLQDSEAESDGEGDTFKLILRSATTPNITLTVRPSTKCGAIVKGFLKKAGLLDKYPSVGGNGVASRKGKSKGVEKDPRLCVDGDKMDNDIEISEADLDDGDMIEVVGL